MMNPNGKKVRDNRIAINLNQYEYDLIMAHCAMYGHEPAAFCRMLILKQARAQLEQDYIIAYYLPSTGTIQVPTGDFAVPLTVKAILEVNNA